MKQAYRAHSPCAGAPHGASRGLVSRKRTEFRAVHDISLSIQEGERGAFFIWGWQKLAVVFGGPMFPLDMYPDTALHLVGATPFPSLLHAPGRIAIAADSGFVWQTALVLTGLADRRHRERSLRVPTQLLVTFSVCPEPSFGRARACCRSR